MPGFNPTALAYRVSNGNACVLLIGDQPIAFAQTVTHTFGFGTEALYGVGSAKPQEIQQLRVGPSITVDNFALSVIGDTLIQGGQTLSGIIANNQFLITVFDGVNLVVLYSYVGCVAEGYNESIPANRPLTEAVSFLAMDVLGPNGQSLLNGQNAYSIPTAQGSNLGLIGGIGLAI